jgi:hypothetical protein
MPVSMKPRSLRALLLLAAVTDAFIGPKPVQFNSGFIVKRGASDRDGEIEDADEAARIAAFRARLVGGGLDAVAKKVESTESEEDDGVDPMWARVAEKPSRGVVLIGRREWFFADKPSGAVKEALKRVGLDSDASQRIPEDRLAGLVPVVLLLDGSQPKAKGYSGVLLGRRSGYMMGDLKELHTNGFMLQPLWVGGPTLEDASSGPIERTVGAPEAGALTGIVAVHPYAPETIPGSVRLTDDGLYAGGDWRTASTLVEKGLANPFRFRLFAQATRWQPGELEKEIQAGAWLCVDVSTDLLLKERDRGARPLPLDVLEELEKQINII